MDNKILRTGLFASDTGMEALQVRADIGHLECMLAALKSRLHWDLYRDYSSWRAANFGKITVRTQDFTEEEIWEAASRQMDAMSRRARKVSEIERSLECCCNKAAKGWDRGKILDALGYFAIGRVRIDSENPTCKRGLVSRTKKGGPLFTVKHGYFTFTIEGRDGIPVAVYYYGVDDLRRMVASRPGKEEP